MTELETELESELPNSEGLLSPALILGLFLVLMIAATVYSLSLATQNKAIKELKAKKAKDLDQEKLLRCRIYAESGIQEAKGRLLWQKEKGAPKQLNFVRRMGASFAGGHDEFLVTLQQKEGGRYQVRAEGTLLIGTQSRYSGQLSKDENRPSSKQASCTIVTEFDFKAGKISNETQVSVTDWLPETPE
ncbi:MAG: hypothetical protein P1V97_27075 [Planctomycetota bacterium]|nr:hypothetical protein [Planctomycetota bacterium]